MVEVDYITLHSNKKERIWLRKAMVASQLPEQIDLRWLDMMLSYSLKGVLNDTSKWKTIVCAVFCYLW